MTVAAACGAVIQRYHGFTSLYKY